MHRLRLLLHSCLETVVASRYWRQEYPGYALGNFEAQPKPQTKYFGQVGVVEDIEIALQHQSSISEHPSCTICCSDESRT